MKNTSKKILLLICLISLASGLKAQDTTKKTAAQTYVSVAPNITNTIGNFSAKFSPIFEIGRQWGVFSLGFDIGRTNSSPVRRRDKGGDTTLFMEFRPNLNIFQVGKFTNTFTPGIGYVPGCKSLMLEFTSGIEYSYTETFHINMFFGQYYYSGLTSSRSVAFVGISFVKYFSKYKPSSVLNCVKL